MKKLIFLFFLMFWINFVYAYEKTFLISAYYTHLDGNKKELKLNWNWKITASWKKPFIWVVAWPKNYPFGTKIYLKWYGVVVVEDRWKAITKKDNYDRLDIWVGYGKEVKKQAIKWWKRFVKWEIVSFDTKTSLELEKDDGLDVLNNITIAPDDWKKEDVRKLQIVFKNYGLYTWNIDGNYDSVKNSLISFQIKNHILSENSKYLWYFGYKTYSKLVELFGKDVLKNIDEVWKKTLLILDFPYFRVDAENPKPENVKKLQLLFKKLWLYDWPINWKFDKIKHILIKWQIKLWVIKSEKSKYVGYFWDKTKLALMKYFEYDLTEKQKEEIDKLIKKVDSFIKRKYRWNILKQRRIRKVLIDKLSRLKEKTKNNLLKAQIKYFLKKFKVTG